MEKSRASIPGPGAYSYLNTIGRDSPSKSFGAKAGELLEAKEQKRIPGPGAYDPHYEKVKRNESGFRIGKESREDLAFRKSIMGKPSPFDYQPRDSYTKSAMANYKFGTSKRDGKNSKSQIPGPGNYDIHSKAVEGSKYSIAGKTHDLLSKKRESLPGPGSYDYRTFEKTIRHDPSFSMGTSKRHNQSFSGAQIPGPGNYNPIDDPLKPRAPGYGFGKGSRDNSLERKYGSPGPG